MPAHPYLDWPGPLAFAHRGGALAEPENTELSVAAAAALGYTYIETDVHVTRDGVPVAFHDPSLDRVTDRGGRIEELTIAEVEAADAGFSWTPDGGRTFPRRATGVRVPRLDDLLERFPRLRFNLDPKSDAAVGPMLDALARHAAWDRCGAGSFSDRRLRRLRAGSGGRLCTSMGPRAVAVARLSSWVRVPRMGAQCIQVPVAQFGVPLVDARMVRAAHRSGLQVHAWTVDDQPTMERLLDLGVDGLMTDAPSLLRTVLEARGAWVAAA